MNTPTSNQERRLSRSLWAVSLVLLACMAFGCKSKVEKPAVTKELPQEQKKEVDVLSTRQAQTFETYLIDQMRTEITKENAEETLKQLQKEIEAEYNALK